MGWHGYIGFENLNLNNTQRASIVSKLKTLGKLDDPQPAKINHWRTSLDNTKLIVETEFGDSELTVASVKNYIADAVGVSPSVVDSRTNQTAYGPMMTLSRNATDYIRILLFGGVNSDWNESREACSNYISANLSEWEDEVVV